MNAVEIEEAVSALASSPFDAGEFPYAFLAAFGNKETTIKRLRSGSSNVSDVMNGVLQRNNIHIAVCAEGRVGETLAALRESPRTAAAKVKFILATDGVILEAEDLISGDTIACDYAKFADHFGFFLPLAGISTVRQIKDNPIDIKATGRLNKLYIELLKDNPDWAAEARRHDLNQFMARLIFCFFAEDTGIFLNHLFTKTIEQMSDSQSGNTHEVMADLFRAMDTRIEDRKSAGLRPWAEAFPYVNGGLFTGKADSPRFSRIARSYLLRAGELDWQEINPDIFGSMIQAVAEDEEREDLGMHYTSVPNILKVLNPLFFDDLREQFEKSGDNARKLRNLRKRLATIRVFDPACGSGNFLVIAYKEMREIEHEIVKRTGDEPKSKIPLANFYGIEIKDFASEIARLSLLIAEFQCDERFIGQREARLNVLPLKRTGQIRTGNALRMDWLKICPPTKQMEQPPPTDLFDFEPEQPEIDFETASVETYICGNPPYLGSKKKSGEHIEDMEVVGLKDAKLLDYVCAFIIKGLDLVSDHKFAMALVSTSSICQGEQVALLWVQILKKANIRFAYTPFKWSNSAARNAGVFCTIVGLQSDAPKQRILFAGDTKKICRNISPYLIEGEPTLCSPAKVQISGLAKMVMGSNPVDGKHLIIEEHDYQTLVAKSPKIASFTRKYGGTDELLSGNYRRCVWINGSDVDEALQIEDLKHIVEGCRTYRLRAGRDARRAASRAHAFCYSSYQDKSAIHVGKVIGNRFDFVPATLRPNGIVCSDQAFTIYDYDLHDLAIILSTMHRVWAEAISGRLGNGVRYANTVVYNTFPVPTLLSSQSKALRVRPRTS